MNVQPNCGLRIADCGLPQRKARTAKVFQPFPLRFLCSFGANPKSQVANRGSRPNSGSVLIIVMWIAFGVVSLALYFAHDMEMSMRAADNQLANLQADQAIEGAVRYYSNILANVTGLNPMGNMNFQPYMLPQTNYYQTANVKVGEGRFWVIGRDTNDSDFSHRSPDPLFCLVDEASKINLNNTKLYQSPDTTSNYMQNLPNMTAQLVGAIYDWTGTNTNPSMNGAKSSTYESLNPPYVCKMTNFDTIGELRMVYGMNLDLLYGEDANLNGALDPNENDGMTLPPTDNNNGMLDPGILEYVTIYTQEPTNFGTTTLGQTSSTITNRASVLTPATLQTFIQSNFPTVYSDIQSKLSGLTASPPTSVLDFAIKSGITEPDFITIEPYLYGSNTFGLVNINTASLTVLSCIPGIGYNNAQTVLSYRQGNPTRLNSIYWFKDAMSSAGTNAMSIAAPWITSRSFQYSADIAAVGHYGRGYRRVKFVFDCSSGVPQIVYRQDLTYLGWALGKSIHDQLLAGTLR
jgi:type II secretory pathway component PulK